MFIEPIRQVSEIQFGILSGDDVLNNSILDKRTNGITNKGLNSNSKPLDDGLNSLKFGANKKMMICQTCGMSYENCPGHFGHINLNHPIFHIGFLDIVKKILNCICIKCGKIRCNYKDHIETIQKLKNNNRLKYIINLSNNIKICSNCLSQLPKIEYQNKKTEMSMDFIMKFATDSMNLKAGYKSEDKKFDYELNALTVYEIFKKIDSKTFELLGFDPNKSKPEDFIITKFPVSPTCIRNSNEEKGLVIDDQLTKNLANIVNSNNLLLEQNNDPEYYKSHVKMLQCYAGLYYDWSNKHIPLSMAPNIESEDKSIAGRIIGRREHKEGRIRGNIMGKRTDWTSRTVITGDSCIRPNEVGCPIYIAKHLTYPEIVTEANIHILSKMVQNGYNIYPGATSIIPKGSKNKLDLRYIKSDYILKVGDIVERHLLDGDIVWFNRQPSLHKYSTMAHHVKIVNDESLMSFRLNIGVTSPYGADFDGDEMNLIIPRSIHTKLELDKLMNVKHNFISAQHNNPLIGCKLDAIVGPFLITNKEFKIPGYHVMKVLNNLSEPIDKKFVIDPKKNYTGKELFSFIIPKNINIKTKDIEIVNGNLVSGFLNKAYVGDGQANSLIKYVFYIYGENEAIKFMTNLMRISNSFNMWYGFTTCLSDIYQTEEQKNKFKELINSLIVKVNLETTEVENDPTISNSDIYENIVKQMLTTIRTNIGNHFLSSIKNKPNNNLNNIAMSNSGGSKVNPDNIARNTVLEGQLVIDGERFPFLDGRRVLPYFTRDSNQPTDRGFNTHGFLDGLIWPEYIFNAMVGRRAKCDEKSKTADSGAVSRKMAIILEDYKTTYDLTVRGLNDEIIQIMYGDNNITAEKQQFYNANILTYNNEQIKEKYFMKDEKYIHSLIKLRDKIRKSIIKTYLNKMPVDFPTRLFIHFNDVKLTSTILKYIGEEKGKEQPTEEYIIKSIKDLLKHNNTPIVCCSDDSIKIKDEKLMKKIMKLYLLDKLSPKKIITEYKLDKKQFDNIIENLKLDIKKNTVQAGESVGILSAYSISERITQAGLDSKHHAGMGGGFGLPDIKQMLDISENLHHPTMTIVLDKKIRNNEEIAKLINNKIKQIQFKDLHDNIEVIFDPDKSYEKKDDIMNNFNNSDIKDSKKINWLFRIFLNKKRLLINSVNLIDICMKLDQYFRNIKLQNKRSKQKKLLLQKILNYEILTNNENSDIPIIHLRLQLKDINVTLFDEIVKNIIDEMIINGISNIENASVVKKNNRFNIAENGDMKQETEYVIQTTGINNHDIRFISNIDLNETMCNSGFEIYNLYGIEALRSYILEVLLDFIGKQANYNHMTVLVDYITHYGKPTGVNFHGMLKTPASIISEASLQQPMTVLQDAAAFNKSDKINGVSGQIMLGQCVTHGSCTSKLIFNTDMVLNSEITDDTELTEDNDNEVINQLLEEEIGDEDFIPN